MLLLLAALAFPTLATTDAVIVEVATKAKFVEMVDKEAKDALEKAITDRIAFNVNKQDIQLTPLAANQIVGHENEPAIYAEPARLAGVDHIYVVRLDSYNQKNRDAGEITNNPNRPGSETKVMVKIWMYDAKTGNLTPAGREERQGTAGGSYFGTTDRTDMMGSPEARSLEIRNINKKRMKAIGDAVWIAIKDAIA